MPLTQPKLRLEERVITPGGGTGRVNITSSWYFWDGTQRIRRSWTDVDMIVADLATLVPPTIEEVNIWRDDYVSP